MPSKVQRNRRGDKPRKPHPDCPLTGKKRRVRSQEITPNTSYEYRRLTDRIIGLFDKNRLVEDIGPDDLRAFWIKLAEDVGPVTLKKLTTLTGSIFQG